MTANKNMQNTSVCVFRVIGWLSNNTLRDLGSTARWRNLFTDWKNVTQLCHVIHL